MNRQVLKERFFLNSKLLEFVIYDYESKTLEVKYKQGKHKGELRKYKDFDSSALHMVIQSDSPGSTLMGILKQVQGENNSVFSKIKSIIAN